MGDSLNPTKLAKERERTGGGSQNQPQVLCKDLSTGLDNLHTEAHGLLEALQDDVATKMGSTCATQ